MASIWRRAWRGLVPGKRRRNRKKLESQGIQESSSGIVRGLQLESLEKRYALDASPVLDPSASPALDVIVTVDPSFFKLVKFADKVIVFPTGSIAVIVVSAALGVPGPGLGIPDP